MLNINTLRYKIEDALNFIEPIIRAIPKTTIVIVTIVILSITYLVEYLNRDITPELQRNNIAYASGQIKVEQINLTNAEKEKKRQQQIMDKAIAEQKRLRECIQQNSLTGVVADCHTYNPQASMIPNVNASEDNTWKTPEYKKWCHERYDRLYKGKEKVRINLEFLENAECERYDSVSSDNYKDEWLEIVNATGGTSPVPERVKWRVNSNGESKSKSELGGDTFYDILLANGLQGTLEHWDKLEDKYKIKRQVPLCIAWADSGLGKYLKTKNNIGNVGNNDRGDRVSYQTVEHGIEAIFITLNNKFLKHKQSIGSLSVGGGGSKPYYATSKENWNINVINCLSTLEGKQVYENYMFRIK